MSLREGARNITRSDLESSAPPQTGMNASWSNQEYNILDLTGDEVRVIRSTLHHSSSGPTPSRSCLVKETVANSSSKRKKSARNNWEQKGYLLYSPHKYIDPTTLPSPPLTRSRLRKTAIPSTSTLPSTSTFRQTSSPVPSTSTCHQKSSYRQTSSPIPSTSTSFCPCCRQTPSPISFTSTCHQTSSSHQTSSPIPSTSSQTVIPLLSHTVLPTSIMSPTHLSYDLSLDYPTISTPNPIDSESTLHENPIQSLSPRLNPTSLPISPRLNPSSYFPYSPSPIQNSPSNSNDSNLSLPSNPTSIPSLPSNPTSIQHANPIPSSSIPSSQHSNLSLYIPNSFLQNYSLPTSLQLNTTSSFPQNHPTFCHSHSISNSPNSPISILSDQSPSPAIIDASPIPIIIKPIVKSPTPIKIDPSPIIIRPIVKSPTPLS